ncbi:MAG: hypothetical protein A2285_05235 [Elusimicrobia bacterium RIFOXYA12_FULL_57_11]|nr:MAG: hypothetical protein A2285_05235 [Elusimicrobia bacterium RIFOXYA12_FULL_57_11]
MPENAPWRGYCSNPEDALAGNAVTLLTSGEASFGGLLDALRGARRFVLLEFYAFSDDVIGRMFARVLREKAAQGVEVYLLYDSVGSRLTERNFFRELAAAGVRVAEFRPVVLWKPYRSWIKRDHRKLVCVDGETAFVGGFNITADDAPRSLGGRGWKDMSVAVKGPAVALVEKLFWETWPDSVAVGGFAARPLAVSVPAPAGNKHVSVLSASGILNSRSIRRAYSYAIERAKERIYITNAYFLPGWSGYRRLIAAARRGVDVRIITPGETDLPYVRWASWSRYGYMIRNGIKLYEWRGPMLHTKAAVIDGLWSSVGSHNLDHRSLYYNLEVNLNVYGREFCGGMTRAFMEDLKNSEQISLAAVKTRPFVSRAASRFLYFFRSWL